MMGCFPLKGLFNCEQSPKLAVLYCIDKDVARKNREKACVMKETSNAMNGFANSKFVVKD
jgi:hypothetical protein